MAQVILQEVTRRFGKTPAVDRVSLAVADGEFFTLLGPSGCGKTTTLRLVAGLEYADEGKVMIGDRDVTRIGPARRRIAMVFQNYALYPHMTVRENIAYPLKLKKLPAGEMKGKVEQAAERLGLTAVLERLPAMISGGQQQRAAVARAMVQDPLVYLFDEPLSNLDARLRLESRRFLKSVLRETGGTAIYVTHDQTEAMALSDRVGVMKEGRLVQVSPPTELYQRPSSTFVASFVGNLPMNLIEGEVVRDGGALFRSGDFSVKLPAAARPGAKLTLGIRPEQITIGGESGPAAEVLDVEHQGSERIVTVEAGGVPLILRLIGEAPLERGDRVNLAVDPASVHLFGEDGQRIEI